MTFFVDFFVTIISELFRGSTVVVKRIITTFFSKRQISLMEGNGYEMEGNGYETQHGSLLFAIWVLRVHKTFQNTIRGYEYSCN